MSTRLSSWFVQIQGSQRDLEHLTEHFTLESSLVQHDEQSHGFVYESKAFSPCRTSEEVLKIADEHFLILSGIFKLVRESMELLRSGAVYRTNEAGGRDIFVQLSEGAQMRAECGVLGTTVTDSQGNVVFMPPPAPRTTALFKLAFSKPELAKAMRLLSAPDAHSWVNLYRIYEVIEADIGGEHSLKTRGWGSSQDLKRFKHSANSVTVAGDAARHGKEQDQPPKNPMSIDEARAYTNYLIEAWLASMAV